MNRKSLLVVAAVTAIAVTAAIANHQRQRPTSEVTAKAEALLPLLGDEINALTKVRLVGAAGSEIVALERREKSWVVGSRGGYPADASKLRDFVLSLANAKTIEAKTASRDRYAQLGVEDVTGVDAKGVLVEMEGLSQPLKLVIGNVNGGGGGGTFVRLADDAQSWLVGGTIVADRSAADWILRDIADIASSRISEVAIDKGGKTLRISKPTAGDGNFVIADIPKGRQPSSEFAANPLASMLAGLRIDDVLPASDAAPAADAVKARYSLFNGVAVDAQAWAVDGKHHARFAASVDPAQADAWIGIEQAKEDAGYQAELAATPAGAVVPKQPLALSDPTKDSAEKRALIQSEVDRLNATFAGWTFVIPAYKFETINKRIDDLLAAPATAAKPAKATGKTG